MQTTTTAPQKPTQRFAIVHWMHLFGPGNHETRCRIAIDLKTRTLVAAQTWSGITYLQLVGKPLADLADSVINVTLAALQTDAVARRILAKGESPHPGQLVGVRLNINVLKRTGVAAHSIHRATSADGHRNGKGFYRGEVITYAPLVQLRDAYFNVNQPAREGIARGTAAKSPMASVDGAYLPLEGLPRLDGVEIRFNPKTTHLFVDLDGFAVRYAQEVTVLGHRVFARGEVLYYTELDAPARAGTAPSEARFKPATTARSAGQPMRLANSAAVPVDLVSHTSEEDLQAA